jgi:hypothetical protein
VDRFFITLASPNDEIADMDKIDESIFSVPKVRLFHDTTETAATDLSKIGRATETFSEILKDVDLFSGRGIAANINSSVLICTGSEISLTRVAVN